MTLEEMFAILQPLGVVDIRGTSLEGPFTVEWEDGTQTTDVTLEELTANAAELQAEGQSTEDATDTRARPRLSTEPVPEPEGGPTPQNKNQPSWWRASDGIFPAEWDKSRYGDYPAIKDKEGFVTGADRVKAASIKAAVDKVSPTVQDTPLPEGRPETQVRGGQEYAYNPATGAYDDFVGPAQGEQGLEQPEFITTPDGQTWVRTSPNGPLQKYTPPSQPQQSLDEFIENLIINATGPQDFERAFQFDDVRDRLNEQRLTPQDAFNLIAPIAQNPQHFAELWNSLAAEVGRGTPDFDQMFAAAFPDTPEGQAAAQTFLGQGGQTASLQDDLNAARGQELADPTGSGTTPNTLGVPGGLSQDQFNSPGVNQAEGLAMQALGLDEFLRRKNAGDTFQQYAVGAPVPSAFQPQPQPAPISIPPWQLYGAAYQSQGPMPDAQKALMDRFRSSGQGATPATATAPATQVTNPFFPQFNADVRAFGGTPFFDPNESANVFQTRSIEDYNAFQQELFKRRGLPKRKDA